MNGLSRNWVRLLTTQSSRIIFSVGLVPAPAIFEIKSKPYIKQVNFLFIFFVIKFHVINSNVPWIYKNGHKQSELAWLAICVCQAVQQDQCITPSVRLSHAREQSGHTWLIGTLHVRNFMGSEIDTAPTCAREHVYSHSQVN